MTATDNYETVAVSQSDQVLGANSTGRLGDIIDVLVVTVSIAASGTVSIGDGVSANIPITAANTPIGVYTVLLGIKAKVGGWRVTTGAGASVVAMGTF